MSDESRELMSTLGPAIHYSAVPKGTPVYGSDSRQVGTVRQVVDNYREHILDGIVITDTEGTVRFVDGPEVSRTFEGGVILAIGASEVAELGPPENGPGVFGANVSAGKIGRLLGGGWKKR
jgi:sporulation protein YlmC with PRC-barrel domain